jgi:hypothetical protein
MKIKEYENNLGLRLNFIVRIHPSNFVNKDQFIQFLRHHALATT